LLQSIGEHNCGLAGGILLFKLVVWMHQKDLDSYVLFGQTYIYYVIWCFQVFLWLGLLVKLVRNVLRASPKTIYEKIGKKKKTRIVVQKVFGRWLWVLLLQCSWYLSISIRLSCMWLVDQWSLVLRVPFLYARFFVLFRTAFLLKSCG
jgi:hypothetical protein